MQKFTKSSIGVFKVPFLLTVFFSAILVGGREPYRQPIVNLVGIPPVDSIRAKNTLTLRKIEEKLKSYDLTHKDN